MILFCISYIIQFHILTGSAITTASSSPKSENGKTATTAVKGNALMRSRNEKLHNFSFIFLKRMADAKAHGWRTETLFFFMPQTKMLNLPDRADEVSSIINCTHTRKILYVAELLCYTGYKTTFTFWLVLKFGKHEEPWQGWGAPWRGKRNWAEKGFS